MPLTGCSCAKSLGQCRQLGGAALRHRAPGHLPKPGLLMFFGGCGKNGGLEKVELRWGF